MRALYDTVKTKQKGTKHTCCVQASDGHLDLALEMLSYEISTIIIGGRNVDGLSRIENNKKYPDKGKHVSNAQRY